MPLHLIQQAISYMEEHICENINYVAAAKSVHMSGYDFHRAFRFLTGMTATEYIRNRRLTLAAQELQSTSAPVIAIAHKYGYESPESFSKAFLRFHGSTPKQAQKKGAKLHLFNPLVIKITVKGGSIMDYRMEHSKAKKYLVVQKAFLNETLLDDNGQSIPDFWADCHQKNLIEPMKALRPEKKGDLYGMCGPVRENETHFYYGIGILVDADTDADKLEEFLQNGYSIWETQPADYAVFQCTSVDGLGETWDKFYKEFIPQTGYVQADGPDYEYYPEIAKNGLFCELWVPVYRPA